MYKYVLFDLDGTLTDSKEGIINSVAYALERGHFFRRPPRSARHRRTAALRYL